MRAFGVTLVVLALLFGTGGVARRPLADTGADAKSAAPPAQDAADSGMCKPSPPPRAVEMDLNKIEPPKDFVSLNGRGYNYRQPGEPPHVIPDSTGKQKP